MPRVTQRRGHPRDLHVLIECHDTIGAGRIRAFERVSPCPRASVVPTRARDQFPNMSSRTVYAFSARMYIHPHDRDSCRSACCEQKMKVPCSRRGSSDGGEGDST
eukprot:9479073-Pyramimonas_sp.AAC.1